MVRNQCGEISIGKSVQCSLPYPPNESPNLTYPTVTKVGIKEMTRQQQRSYAYRTLGPDEVVRTLEERVTYLEQVVETLLKER